MYFLKRCYCNSSSRPTTQLYLNKSIMNSIAMGREKKGHCTKPSQAHSFHANHELAHLKIHLAKQLCPAQWFLWFYFIPGPCQLIVSALSQHFLDTVLEDFNIPSHPILKVNFNGISCPFCLTRRKTKLKDRKHLITSVSQHTRAAQPLSSVQLFGSSSPDPFRRLCQAVIEAKKVNTPPPLHRGTFKPSIASTSF